MKPKLQNFIVPAISAMVGGLAVVAAARINPAIQPRVESSATQFQGLDQMYDEMFKRPLIFHDKFDGGLIDDISQREDDKFIYYDVMVPDVKSTSISTKVERGYIMITGTVERKNSSSSDEKSGASVEESYYKSSFNRTFPLPEHIDQNKMEMYSEKDKVVLKFPKLTS